MTRPKCMRPRPTWRRGALLAVCGAWRLAATAGETATTLPTVRRLEPLEMLAAASAVTTNRYPDADSVLVDAVVRQSYEADGTALAESEEYLKVLTEKGRREAQTQTFFFALPYDTVSVVRAAIYKPDGRCATVDVARASRVMTDTSQMSANIYDPSHKVLHLSLAGVEIGDLVHCATSQRTFKPRVPDTWSDYTLFEFDVPIRRLTYAVAAPRARPLRHMRLRDPIANTVAYRMDAAADGRELHVWEARDVPQLFKEPNMPPAHTVAQRLLLSTAQDWPALSRWYWNLCQPRLAAVTPEMKAAVAELTATGESRDEKVRRLFTWVSQNIRYMGITTETEAPGYEPHDVSMTFSNRYGVCRDKAALLVAMLRLADVDAYPVLIHAGARLDPDVPMTFFNHAIVAAARPGSDGYDLMDPTDEQARDPLPTYLGNRSYLVAHPTGETLRVSPVSPAASNLVTIVSQGAVDESGRLDLRTEIAFAGVNDNLYRGHLSRLPRERRRQFFEGLVKARLAGAELVAFALTPEDLQDTGQPLRVRLESRVEGFAVEGDGVTVLEPPWLSRAVGYVNFLLGRTGLRQRRFALETEIPCGTEERCEIDLAAAVGAVRSLPGNVAIARAGIVYDRRMECAGGRLRAEARFLLERPEYPAADYPALKETLRELEYAGRQRLRFEPGGSDAAPDMRILEDSLRIDLASAHCWTSTSRRVQQILTYAGTKEHAELRLPFNPAWQTVEIVSAVVSNADGRVHVVKPEEINLMDASWAGGAPRYAAGKTLVVSLPGVETGSVTAVTIRRTQRDAPFFALRHPFRGHEPVDAATVELAAPRGLPLLLRHPGATVTYSCRTNGAALTHRWQAARLAAVPREDALPPWHCFTPVLLASSGNWADYAAGLRREVAAALRADDRAARLARRLADGERDAAGKARAVRDFVMRAIRPAGPDFHELPPGFTPADVTLADGYGHAADRAILMVAMLRAAGLEAAPLLADGSGVDSPLVDALFAVPQSGLFDTWLVAARPRASWLSRLLTPGRAAPFGLAGARDALYLNDGDQYGELGATALFRHAGLTLSGQRTVIDLPEALRPRDWSDWSIAVDDLGTAWLAVTNRYSGAECGDFRRRFREMTPEMRSRHFQELVGAISQAAEPLGEPVVDLESYPGLLSYQVRAPRFAARDGNALTLTLPDPPAPLWALRADRRANPLHVSRPADTLWICRLLLPAATREAPVLPPAVAWELPAGMGRLVCATRRERLADGRLLIELRRELRRECALVAPELYPALLEMNRRLTHPAMRTVVALLEE